MNKLAPAIFAKLEQSNPQEYQKAVVPHAVRFFDASGFPEAFDQMVQYFKQGKSAEGSDLAAKLAQWFSSQRQGIQQQTRQADPEVERLRQELQERDKNASAQNVDRIYSDTVSHAGPVIDRYLKPIVARLGLSAEQYQALRQDTWDHLQTTRNSDAAYKTVVQAKYRQGAQQTTDYMKQETESRAAESARVRANFWYGHQLKNGAQKPRPNPTDAPVTAVGISRGREPSPNEILYGPRGEAIARKSGFKDLTDMILGGKAPLKPSGGIRQWR
jgi:hypothetical protein